MVINGKPILVYHLLSVFPYNGRYSTRFSMSAGS